MNETTRISNKTLNAVYGFLINFHGDDISGEPHTMTTEVDQHGAITIRFRFNAPSVRLAVMFDDGDNLISPSGGMSDAEYYQFSTFRKEFIECAGMRV